MMQLTIYVPTPEGSAASLIWPKSAIVGYHEQDLVTCYYEGGTMANVMDFSSRLKTAASRLVARYPTVATATVREYDLVAVGSYDGTRSVVTAIFDPARLHIWCGESPEAVAGIRLPSGQADWATAAGVSQPPRATPLGHQRSDHTCMWFKTQAGQIIRFNLADSSADVFDHDDPKLPELLVPLGLDTESLERAIGSESSERTAAPGR
jgi:hypothetical protein